VPPVIATLKPANGFRSESFVMNAALRYFINTNLYKVTVPLPFDFVKKNV
jgi:hypothetical protein